ncbi:MAG TPA: SDR family oxidoreductase [Mycobacteriales bacterium]|jgi:NAD(P)-dependent dehydrogenase (short-subunit alcohol dehydrogenase family)|nr:SDR family oxidoreductase [Mycobacteriales bacterium]
MSRMYAVTGSASGIGAAIRERLIADGHSVIGVDRVDADVVADLGSAAGRAAAVAGIADACGGALAGLVTCAGVAGLPDRPGSLLVSVNYFGTVEVIAGLREQLAVGGGSVVAISSNSTTCQPGYSLDLVDTCLAGDESVAGAMADQADSVMTYPATKTAIARWIRRHSTAPEWIGAGIRLNAIAPGLVETPLAAEQRNDPTIGPLVAMFPLPLGRGGAPPEIADAAVFLLNNQFCVGTLLLIDGGTEALLRPDAWPTLWEI